LTTDRILVTPLTMTTLPLGEVKSHLSELVGRVHDHHERVTVTVHGRPSAVLVALEDLEQLEETLAILRDADTMRRLASSDAELARGESVSADELAEVIRRRSADPNVRSQSKATQKCSIYSDAVSLRWPATGTGLDIVSPARSVACGARCASSRS
jgi:antitoxin YefM